MWEGVPEGAPFLFVPYAAGVIFSQGVFSTCYKAFVIVLKAGLPGPSLY